MSSRSPSKPYGLASWHREAICNPKFGTEFRYTNYSYYLCTVSHHHQEFLLRALKSSDGLRTLSLPPTTPPTPPTMPSFSRFSSLPAEIQTSIISHAFVVITSSSQQKATLKLSHANVIISSSRNISLLQVSNFFRSETRLLLSRSPYETFLIYSARHHQILFKPVTEILELDLRNLWICDRFSSSEARKSKDTSLIFDRPRYLQWQLRINTLRLHLLLDRKWWEETMEDPDLVLGWLHIFPHLDRVFVSHEENDVTALELGASKAKTKSSEELYEIPAMWDEDEKPWNVKLEVYWLDGVQKECSRRIYE
ncbi:hypothetical protein P280DRAFT_542002 [Massarina eburnea CBS 473.64]|uniref:F-box domain-containing protein n=1 Tax=Massarina eburnea CBS 473.64 TaxID=1395130 RepID=A0A6A6RJD3_9PLEO|nr:hypothetical protein P280DRAFT_542002 [Massarina eburnea CBS 473.64]